MEMEIELTEISKKWLLENRPQGIAWEYAPDKPFKLHSVAAEFVELIYLGVPYRITSEIDGQPTIRKAVP